MNVWIIPTGAAVVFLIVGCGGSEPVTRGTTSAPGEIPGDVPQAESSFRPADYGVETWNVDTVAVPHGEVTTGANPTGSAEPDTIPGYRVQVSITGDIDDANGLRNSLSDALPEEWVYVVYHAPYYKIRVGNFAERFAAGEMLERLRQQGFPDAWIVPDRVVRIPAPRPSDALPADTVETTDPPH